MKSRGRQAEIKWADGKKEKVIADLGCAANKSEMDVSDDPGFFDTRHKIPHQSFLLNADRGKEHELSLTTYFTAKM